MAGADLNTNERPPGGMGPAQPTLQPAAHPALPEPLRHDLVASLHAANAHLRELARIARSRGPPRPSFERAIGAAWSNLATLERIAGLDGVVSTVSTARRILVVDDSPDMRSIVTRTLSAIAPHATIGSASDVAQALSLLEDVGPGDGVMVITDHDMGPGPTGVDLLAAIASRHPRSHRVLFTGHPVEHFQGLAVEAHALLSKAGPDALRRYFGAP